MGPPPPPSASYLWKFDEDTDDDNDTDDDDDDDCNPKTANRTTITTNTHGSRNINPTTGTSNTIHRISSSNVSHHDNEDGDDNKKSHRIRNNNNSSNDSFHNTNRTVITEPTITSATHRTKPKVDDDCKTKSTTTITKKDVTPVHETPSIAAMIMEVTKTNLYNSHRWTSTTTTTNPPTTTIDNHDSFDTTRSIEDSGDDEDDDFMEDESPAPTNITSSSSSSSTMTTTNNSTKKRKKGKKKRKKKVSANATTTSSVSPNTTMTDISSSTTSTTKTTSTTTSTSTVIKQHVTFHGVTVFRFRRCLGMCVVPTHGGWPLGMEYYDSNSTTSTTTTTANHHTSSNSSSSSRSTIHKDQTPILNWNDTTTTNNNMDRPNIWFSMDEYENKKYERLYERYQKLQPPANTALVDNQSNDIRRTKHRGGGGDTRKTTNHHKGNGVGELILETRQWDYKNRQKNPLFGILHESDRMNLLLNSCSPPDEVVRLTATGTIVAATNPSTTSSSGRTSSSSNSNKSTARTRSNGSLSGSNTSHHGTTGHGEQFNHIYTSTYVHSVRNALEQIRIDRTTGIGCSCRKLHVPIVSSSTTTTTTANNHTKKSHHHNTGNNSNNKRMKLQKLKDELMKRNLLPVVSSNESDATANTMTREEMEQLLHDTVEKEPCCLYTDTCFCARNSMGCQADVCTCWHSSHNSTGSNSKSDKKSSSAITVQEIQQRCGNNVGGMYVVDDHKIDTFRNDYLNRLKVCPFITLE